VARATSIELKSNWSVGRKLSQTNLTNLLLTHLMANWEMPVNDAHFYEYFVMPRQWCFTLAWQLSYVNRMWYLSVYSIYALGRDCHFFIPSSAINLFFIISLPQMLCIFLRLLRWNFLCCHVRGIEDIFESGIFYDAIN
jgi:hypothetical protein